MGIKKFKKFKSFMLVIAILMVFSLEMTTAYADEQDYVLKYGKTVIKDEVIENTMIYNKLVRDTFGDHNYRGIRFGYTVECKGLHSVRYTDRIEREEITHSNEISMQGIIGLPDKPISDKVFILLHGRMGIVPNSEYGFSYLVDYIASNGYKVISLNVVNLYQSNVDEEEVFEKAVLELINSVNNNEIVDLDTLKNINIGGIEEVSLLGHSRAGYHVIKIADALFKNNIQVSNIISIAPLSIDKIDRAEMHEIPMKIIIPEFDGDVSLLDGEDIYNSLASDKYPSKLELYYIFGANHNYFNTAMLKDDSSGWVNARSDLYELLPREKHMRFVIGLISEEVSKLEQSDNLNCVENLKLEHKDTDKSEYINIIDNRSNIDYLMRQYEPDYKSIVYNLDTTESAQNSEVYEFTTPQSYVEFERTAFRLPGRDKTTAKFYVKMQQFGNITFDIKDCTADSIIVDLALDSTTYLFDPANQAVIGLAAITSTGDVLIKNFPLTYVIGYTEKIGSAVGRYSTYTPYEQLIFDIPNNITIDQIVLVTSTSMVDIVIKDIYLEDIHWVSE